MQEYIPVFIMNFMWAVSIVFVLFVKTVNLKALVAETSKMKDEKH